MAGKRGRIMKNVMLFSFLSACVCVGQVAFAGSPYYQGVNSAAFVCSQGVHSSVQIQVRIENSQVLWIKWNDQTVPLITQDVVEQTDETGRSTLDFNFYRPDSGQNKQTRLQIITSPTVGRRENSYPSLLDLQRSWFDGRQSVVEIQCRGQFDLEDQRHY
jgi:hypothetical protein